MILTDLFEFFSNGYFYFFVTAFGLLLALGTLIISYLRTQKIPLIQLIITAVLLALVFLKPILVLFGVKPEFSNVNGETVDGGFDLAVVIISAVLVLGDHVVYLLFTNGNLSRKSLFVLAPDKTGRQIYLYMDHKGRVSLYNKPFIDKLELTEENKNWKKEATNFVCEGNYLYNDFLKTLNTLEDGVVNFSIEINGKAVDYQLEKITIKEMIKEEETVVGSIFVALEGECEAKEEAKEEAPEEAPEEVAEEVAEEAAEEVVEEAAEEPAEEVAEEPAEEEKAEEPVEEVAEEVAEEPAEEEKAEEPAEEEKAEEVAAEEPAEENKELSEEDLKNVDLDNSFLDDKE